ncbi:type II toxin-antitoxin system HicB family antitoxin [Candidatus Uhrbacteria bacterium]|nr:type II toxin-antitoxin system HicB family antitoxin [Candidatus Uhrbacteria bacterium]
MTYTCTTVISQEGKWFVARCIELGVISQGKTIQQAEANLKEAVELYLEDQPRHRRLLSSRRAPLVTTLQIRHG